MRYGGWIAFALVLALVGCAVTDRGGDSRAGSAVERWPPVGQFAETTAGRVHYLQQGAGPDVVLLHGASGNLRDFSFDLMDRLVARGYRVTAFDRPGLGYTDRADPSYDRAFTRQAESPAEQAAMLSEAAEQIGIERPIVVGHSFGGAVAMAWALEEDAAGVVSLAGATMPWPGELGAYYQVLGSAVGGAFLPPLAAAFIPPMSTGDTVASIFEPQEMPEGYLEHIGPGLTLRTDVLRANARQINTLKPHITRMAERYPDLAVPVEFVHGDADKTVPLRVHSARAVELIPDANLTVLEGVGHMPHHARPGAAIAAIDRVADRAGLR